MTANAWSNVKCVVCGCTPVVKATQMLRVFQMTLRAAAVCVYLDTGSVYSNVYDIKSVAIAVVCFVLWNCDCCSSLCNECPVMKVPVNVMTSGYLMPPVI